MRPQSSNRVVHSSAFVVETVVLLAFLAISLTVITSMFAKAHTIGQEADETTAAIILATTGSANGAEAFAADPTGKEDTILYYTVEDGSFSPVESYVSGNYAVRRTIEPKKTEGGVLYKANIEVSHMGKPVYTLTTSSYVSDGRQ